MDIPIRSGNSFIDAVFDMCVRLLLLVGKIFGLSYNTVNVMFFMDQIQEEMEKRKNVDANS